MPGFRAERSFSGPWAVQPRTVAPGGSANPRFICFFRSAKLLEISSRVKSSLSVAVFTSPSAGVKKKRRSNCCCFHRRLSCTTRRTGAGVEMVRIFPAAYSSFT